MNIEAMIDRLIDTSLRRDVLEVTHTSMSNMVLYGVFKKLPKRKYIEVRDKVFDDMKKQLVIK